MTQPLEWPHAQLITAFGTVLYIDVASGDLRHGPVESSPNNVRLVPTQFKVGSCRRAQLTCHSNGVLHQILCRADRCHVVSFADSASSSPILTVLELIPLERGLLGLKAKNLFLTAFPDGRVLLSANKCSTWELFLASESWCTEGLSSYNGRGGTELDTSFDRAAIASYLIHPLIRVRTGAKPRAKKILIFGYTKWSHGRVYYDLSKLLYRHGYVVDILDWQVDHSDYFVDLIRYYDFFLTAPDGVQYLVDLYGIPYEKIIALSHHEFDIRMLIDQKGTDVFARFAGYGVVSEFLYCASIMKGIQRVPMIASLGVNYSEFNANVSEQLSIVGYASSIAVTTYGVEWKRGKLAETAAHEAGLAFKIAGSTSNQTSFHDMPSFYKSVDAVLISSISEAAQLPVIEAAAAGRLVIGTPVGHFPGKAYLRGGIMAPVEAEQFKSFAASILRYYKDNPSAYVAKCHEIQEAARKFDWMHSIGEWIDLIENKDIGKERSTPRVQHHSALESRGVEHDGTITECYLRGQIVHFYVTNPSDAIMKHHFANSFYEIEELEIIERNCPKSGAFIDIGANIGNHSLFVAKFMKIPKIIVFEPNQNAIPILLRNLSLNACDNVDTQFLGIALANKQVSLTAWCPDPDNLGHTVFNEDPNGIVRAVEGDALILDEHIGFIKLDVEGMELEILSGLTRTIKRWRPVLFIEVWEDKRECFFEWCQKQSYEIVEQYQRYHGIQNYLARPIS